MAYPLSQFVSTGKLKKRTEFLQSAFVWINDVAGHCTRSYTVITYYQYRGGGGR